MRARYLVAGAHGMLGTALQRVLAEQGAVCVAPDERDFDITDAGAVADTVRRFADEGGGALINAAAYTNVERAEDDVERAYAVNEAGARLLAEAARAEGLPFVHVSTDFVFDGAKHGAYTEDDAPNPLSVYGASKLAGERAVAAVYPQALIVRTAWVFGPGGTNFPEKILERARTSATLEVVTDEVGSPTYTIDLARGILALLGSGERGLFHLAGAGACSRYELACAVLEAAGMDREVRPVLSAEFPSRAPRPRNSVLDCSRAAALGVVMPAWQDAVRRYIATV